MITIHEQLFFSYNWNNKLSCTAFTTFRPHNPRKYVAGKLLSILLQGKHLKDVEVKQVKTLKLPQVNEFIARLDTGYNVEQFTEMVKTMYKNKGIDFENADWDLILCVEVKPDKGVKKKTEQLALEIA